MRVTDVYKKIAIELGIPVEEVQKAYESFWEFMRNTISDIPIDTATEEELGEMKTSFNVPELGKFYYKGKRKYDKNKESKANPKSYSDNS